MKNVNERIAKCRRLANLTQTDIAEKLNIKCSTYSQMERQGIVSAERLFQMAEIFGVTPCYLYNGEEPCKKSAELDFAPPQSISNTVLKQPEPNIKKDIFVITKKEENLIKLIRNFSKADYDKAMKFIEDIYRKNK